MPELPEVETIRRDLLSKVRGKKITGVTIPPDPRGSRVIRRYPSADLFRKRLKNRSIVDLKRRGKYLLFHLDSGDILIIHLGMSGRLLLVADKTAPPIYTRLFFRLATGKKLCFADPRKFGEAYLYSREKGHICCDPFSLGPEPLGDELSPADLSRMLAGRKAAVKALLLNQKIIAGLGNIYADESLFRAGIDPRKPAGEVTAEKIPTLLESIRKVLEESIRSRGTTASNGQYVDGKGNSGSFQFRLNVYQRKGESCRRCGAEIETVRIAGRTSHFCPRCQK